MENEPLRSLRWQTLMMTEEAGRPQELGIARNLALMKHPITHFRSVAAIPVEPCWSIVALKIVVVYYHSLFSERVFALAGKKFFHI